MARKKKGQKKPDEQAGGDASANAPGAPGTSTSQDQGPKSIPKTQEKQQDKPQQKPGVGQPSSQQKPNPQPKGAWQKQEQPRSLPQEIPAEQQREQGAWQAGGRHKQEQHRGQTQETHAQQQQIQGSGQGQSAWRGQGVQQSQGSGQGQSAWKGQGVQQSQGSGQGQSARRGQGVQQASGRQQQQYKEPSPQASPWHTGQPQTQQKSHPQEHGQGAYKSGGTQRQEPHSQKGQGAYQTGGTQRQEPHSQQGQGAYKTGGTQRQEPYSQQGQGAYRAGGTQRQQPPSQQGQGAYRTGGTQPHSQQGQGAYQRGGTQRQEPHSQQGQGAQQQSSWQKGKQQQPFEQQRTSVQSQSRQGQGAIVQPQSMVQYSTVDQGLRDISISGSKTPGTKGRKIIVETNYLNIDFGKCPKAYHYDVQITPDTPKRWLRDVFEQFRKKHFPKNNPAFDGKRNMYSSIELVKGNQVVSDEIEFQVPHETRTKTYKVSVQFATEVDLSPLRNMKMTTPQQAMQCVEIVLRSAPAMKCIQAGRSFYTRPPGIIKLGEGMEMYYGFYQTVVRGWKPFFNVDVAHKAFPIPMNIIELIAELGSDWRNTMTPEDLKRAQINRDLESKLSKFLKTLRVFYEIPGTKREYKVNGLDAPPRFKEFTIENKTMTIEEYFQKKYGIRLNYPLMPTLWVGSPARQDKILLPAELCTVVENQTVNRKMTENQTSNMIKQAATSTDIRKKKIMTSLGSTRHNENPCVREFGFRINNDFERIQARVLEPPALEYSNGSAVKPSKGVWRQDNNRFFRGAELSTWIIISACGSNLARDCTNLANMIASQGNKCGMRLSPKPGNFDCVQSRMPTQKDLLYILDRYKQYSLIFVIIPDSGPVYSYVKKAAEINLNCLTQCIKRRTLSKMNPSTVGNILLKVNSKLSGTNHCLQSKPLILQEPCMIMGADVTHPSPDSKDIPSVVAVTASHDPQALYGYNMCCRLQLPTVEIIEDLEEITREHLLYFYKQNRQQKPRRIIFFRDGVSEGQFAEVKQTELSAIRRACSKLEDTYQPKITFIVVQKRHHTRFFPTNPRDSEDRNCNVPAGTCVDTVITSPNVQDFYLVSHASIQGVAKPTKYSTLWDDNNLSYDDIEQIAYYLCHLFSRCNRSVSYPAPTYYAHLGAARAKVYIENESINFANLKNEQRKLGNDGIRRDKPMFFV